ncbi:hypothetical protein QUA43_03430 [Microcoleus sp. N9_B4]
MVLLDKFDKLRHGDRHATNTAIALSESHVTNFTLCPILHVSRLYP